MTEGGTSPAKVLGIIGTIVGIIVGIIAIAQATHHDPPAPKLDVYTLPSWGQVGEPVEVHISGFVDDYRVEVSFGDYPMFETALDSGDDVATFNVPQASPGNYRVVVTGEQSQATTSSVFGICAPGDSVC